MWWPRFNRPTQPEAISFCEAYRDIQIRNQFQAVLHIHGLQADADKLAEQISELMQRRAKVVSERAALIEMTNTHRKSLGMDEVDFDAPQPDFADDEDYALES